MVPNVHAPSLRSFFRAYNQILMTIGSLLIGLFSVVIASSFIQSNAEQAPAETQPERVFRICKWITAPDGSKTQSFKTPGKLGPEINTNLGTAIEGTARFMVWPEQVELSDFRQQISTDHWAFADPAILPMFEIKFIRGNAGTALAVPGQLILSERYAKKLFGASNPVGKTLLGLGGKIYTVSAVVENTAAPAALQFDVIASWASTLEESGLHQFPFMHNWTAQLVETFVRLQSPEQISEIQTAILQLTKDSPNASGCTDMFLQPVSGNSPKTGTVSSPDQARFGSKVTAGPNKMVLMSQGWFM